MIATLRAIASACLRMCFDLWSLGLGVRRVVSCAVCCKSACNNSNHNSNIHQQLVCPLQLLAPDGYSWVLVSSIITSAHSHHNGPPRPFATARWSIRSTIRAICGIHYILFVRPEASDQRVHPHSRAQLTSHAFVLNTRSLECIV